MSEQRPGERSDHEHDPHDEPGHGPDHGHDRVPPLPPELGETTGRPGIGGTYVYVKGELVVADGQAAVVRALLAELWTDIQWEEIREHPVEGLKMTRLRLPEAAPTVPELMDGIRLLDGGEALAVSPNYALGWTSHPGLIPCGPPLVGPISAELEQAVQGTEDPKADPVLVGLVDTGLVSHPWLDDRCTFRQQDEDQPDRDGDNRLDYGVGHGTFIAGLILEHTPRAVRVTARRLQTTSNSPPPHQPYATDVDLATGLLEWSNDDKEFPEIRVLVIAMGGYAFAGEGLPTTERALQVCRSKNQDLVVVAGAGNDNTRRPFFPAALKDVVAVAALRDKDERACFSNFGWWVDACAPGVNVVSTFPRWTGRALTPHAPPSRACLAEVPDTPQGNQDFDLTASWRGTSFAAPIVAAWIARWISVKHVSGREAVNDLRGVAGVRSPLPGLEDWLPDLGRVVRPPFTEVPPPA
jgi:Subtilase family